MAKQTCTMKIAVPVHCVNKLTTKAMKIGSLQFQRYPGDVHKFQHTLLREIVAETLHHCNICVRWLSKMLGDKKKSCK